MSIPKTIRTISMYLLLFLFLLMVAIYSIVNLHTVQTFLAQKATNYLSKELKTEVKIERIEIEFLKTAVLHGLLINDLHHDTLIYAKKAKINYTGFFKKENRVQFSNLEVENGRLKVRQYKNETDLNIDFFVDYINPPSTIKRPKGYIYQTIASKKLALKNVFFSYRFEADTVKTNLFNSSDIEFKNISAQVENFAVLRDTISFYCNNLEANEKCGLKIQKLHSAIRVSPSFVEFDNFKLKTAHSNLAGTFHIKTTSYRDYNDFENLVYMKGKFTPSEFSMFDAAHFNENVIGLNLNLTISGEIKGTEASIKGKNLNIKFGDNSIFKGNVSMKGLPNWQNTYTYLDIEELTTNKKDIEKIQSYPFTTGDYITLPKEIEKLGDMKIKGTFTGFESDFVSTASVNTALGLIETDIEMKTNFKNEMAYYKGKLRVNNFDLGIYYGLQEYVGKLSVDVDINGHGLEKNNVDANIKGFVNNFNFIGYPYKNIEVDGNFTQDIFEGNFNLNDPNANLNFDGKINLTDALPSYDFKSHVSLINLTKLGIINGTNSAIVSSNLNVNIKGDNIDNLVGDIRATNTIFHDNTKAFKFNNIVIKSNKTAQGKKLSVQSDILNGAIEGQYTLMKIGKAFKQLVTTYIPSLEENKKIKTSLEDKTFTEHFTFDFDFLNSQPISKLFLKQIEILPGTKLNGHFYADKKDFSFTCLAKEIKFSSYPFKNFKLNAKPSINSKTPEYNLSVSTDKIVLSDSSFIESLQLTNLLSSDTLNSKIAWLNKSKIKNYGNVNIQSVFTHNNSTISLLPSEIVIQDSAITINPKNYFVADSTGVSFHNMDFGYNQQSLALNSLNTINGYELTFIFKNFTLNWLNPLLKNSRQTLGGTLNGQGTLGFANNNLLFTTTIIVNDFLLNGEALGDGSLICVYNDKMESIAINGKFLKNEYAVLSARGFYYPYKESDDLDLEITLDKFSLKHGEMYTKGIFSNLNGYVTGDLILKGSSSEPILEGVLELQKCSFKIDYINTTYTFNGFTKLQKNKISFKEVDIFDIKGNKAKVSGEFKHEYFDKLSYKINVDANKLMCLNTVASQNELFYGKAFASGLVEVNGDLDNVNFNIAAKSEKGTFFVIPLYGAEEITQNSFIEFVKRGIVNNKADKKVDLTGIEMNFELELTPDADIQMMFDPKVGDAITGNGNGNLKMSIDKKGNFAMLGNYTIQQGKYLFTLQNVINKKFVVEPGGTIQWTGDPFDADININAIYSLSTSLNDLDKIDLATSKSNGSKRVPVNCKLMMTDKLMKPTIKFDITLPNADQTTRDAVRAAINPEIESDMNKQVFSLLMLGKFVPVSGSDNNTASNPGGYAVKNTGSELLSNQISNWLGNSIKNVNLGLKYNSADGENANREVAIATSTQLFNNRMSIDGTFGYNSVASSRSQSPSTIIGDVNIDYKLTNDGKLRLKGFNRSNDYSQMFNNANQYIQGVGINYNESFETFSELILDYRERQKLRKEFKLEKKN